MVRPDHCRPVWAEPCYELDYWLGNVHTPSLKIFFGYACKIASHLGIIRLLGGAWVQTAIEKGTTQPFSQQQHSTGTCANSVHQTLLSSSTSWAGVCASTLHTCTHTHTHTHTHTRTHTHAHACTHAHTHTHTLTHTHTHTQDWLDPDCALRPRPNLPQRLQECEDSRGLGPELLTLDAHL